MKLIEYLSKYKISQTKFSKLIGISQSAIANYIAEKRKPSVEIQARIREATNYMVSFADWIDLVPSKNYYEEVFLKHDVSVSKISKILMIKEFEVMKVLESDSLNKQQRFKLDVFCEELEFLDWYKKTLYDFKKDGVIGFGQKQIAKVVGLSVSSVSMKLEGKGAFSYEQIKDIKKYAKELEKKKKKEGLTGGK